MIRHSWYACPVKETDQLLGIDLLLYGIDELDENDNTSIFEAIHQFLMESNRL